MCISTRGIEVSAMQKEATVKASLEATDLMMATMVAPSIESSAVASDSNKSMVALEKVKLSGLINTSMEKIAINYAKVDAKYAEVCQSLVGLKVGLSGDAVKELEESLQKHRGDAKVHFAKREEEGKMLQESLGAVSTSAEIISKRKDFAEFSKLILGGDSKLFFSKCASATRFVEKSQRVSASAAAADGPGVGKQVLSAGYIKVAVIRDEMENGSHNLCSLFESKAGLRAATVLPLQGTDPVGIITAIPATKKSVKDMRLYLQANAWGIFAVTDAKRKAKLMKELKKAYDPAVFSTLPLPSGTDWPEKVYALELFGTCDNFYNVACTHMGAMEMRVLMYGTETLIGIPIDDVQGDDLKAKRAFLNACTATELKELVVKKGWAATHSQASALLVPSGCLIMTIGNSSMGFRWSVASDPGDQHRVRLSLQELIRSFRELAAASTGYSQFMQFLESE